MTGIILFGLAVVLGYYLVLKKAPLVIWFLFTTAITLTLQSGLYQLPNQPASVLQDYSVNFGSLLQIIGWLPALIIGLLAIPPIRKAIFTGPVFNIIRSILPKVSETEQEALDAGTIGWDAELFSGQPDWKKLREVPKISLTAEEQAFIDGPTNELCEMIRDWEIRQGLNDIPNHIWNFIREKGFFGMLISKEHGGLGFSAQAQSIIVGQISACSPDIGICVMVPNSLGPGELIEKYGTDQQKEKYLENLAKGIEVPCFALTGPTSGSDAATMRDIGIVCKEQFNGKETLGIKLSWEKRYITLGPKATILGLAFRVFDPENLIGDQEDVGITCALIPTDHEGVNIGRRHQPAGCGFPNGPNWGNDVFIPMDWVIGGQEFVGQGWRMLMSCLAVGRAISLPATGSAATKQLLRVTTAYAQIRKQFGLSIGRMEGIQEPLARMAEAAYITESARGVTASMVGAGAKPAVISALLKYQATQWMRQSVSDAMDIHGGRAICDGPKNYIVGAYAALPISITVEGANILTRTLIVFAQGALRSHPYLYAEVQAAQNKKLGDFDKAFMAHLGFMFSNMLGSFWHNISGGYFANKPDDQAGTGHWYKQLSRYSRNFALIADMTVGLLGGGLKVKQQITGRLADALSELYLMSCMLKRFEDDGAPAEDRQILDYTMQNSIYRFEQAVKGVILNFPVKSIRPLLNLLIFPLGARAVPSSDHAGQKIVRQIIEPSALRDNLTRFLFRSNDVSHPVGLLEVTLKKVVDLAEVEKKLERAVKKGIIHRFHGNDWFEEAIEKNVITSEEAKQLRELEQLVNDVISVDHFDPKEIVRKHYLPNDLERSVA